MATPTTTVETIRDQQISLIQALTPAKHSSVRFEVARDDQAIEIWAAENPAASLRRFTIRAIGAGFEPPAITNLDHELRDEEFEITVAYPRHYGRYGADNARDLHDLVRQDLYTIDGKSGIGMNNPSGYVSGQHAAILTDFEIEDNPEDPVVYSRLTYRVVYYRAVTA